MATYKMLTGKGLGLKASKKFGLCMFCGYKGRGQNFKEKITLLTKKKKKNYVKNNLSASLSQVSAKEYGPWSLIEHK